MIIGFSLDTIIWRIVLATSPSILAPNAQYLMPTMISPALAHSRRSKDLSSSNSGVFKMFLPHEINPCFVTRRFHAVNETMPPALSEAGLAPLPSVSSFILDGRRIQRAILKGKVFESRLCVPPEALRQI